MASLRYGREGTSRRVCLLASLHSNVCSQLIRPLCDADRFVVAPIQTGSDNGRYKDAAHAPGKHIIAYDGVVGGLALRKSCQ